MNPYELIDNLCEITSLQADIIRRQQAVIMQHGIEAEDPSLEQLCSEADERMDVSERNLRIKKG